MIVSSAGIVLASFPYSDTSVICKVYTREYGLNSFLLKGAKSPKNKLKLAALRPLQSIEVVHYRGRSDLHLVKDIRILQPFHSIASLPEKSCISLFIAEVLNRSLSDNITDERLFDFLLTSAEWLEFSGEYLNFHIQFLLQYSRYLGFYPKTGQDTLSSFGVMSIDSNNGVLQRELQLLLDTFIARPDYASSPARISNAQRRELLSTIVSFYSRHLETGFEIKSLPVLQSIFSD